MNQSDFDANESRLRLFSPQLEEVESFDEICRDARGLLKTVVEARLDIPLLQRVDASDVVQETLMEAYSRWDDFRTRRPMPLIAWLRETAIQQVSIAIRRHRTAAKRSVSRQVSLNQSSVIRLVEQLTAIHDTAEKQCERRESAMVTERALMRLEPLDREILLLRYINGVTNQEAAVMLGITDTAASKRHVRALSRLQNELERP